MSASWFVPALDLFAWIESVTWTLAFLRVRFPPRAISGAELGIVQMISRQQRLAAVVDTKTANLRAQLSELIQLRDEVRKAQLSASLPKTAIAKWTTPTRSRPRGRSQASNIAEWGVRDLAWRLRPWSGSLAEIASPKVTVPGRFGFAVQTGAAKNRMTSATSMNTSKASQCLLD
jgi:hypothetical protein